MIKTIVAQLAVALFTLFPMEEGINATVSQRYVLPEVEVVAKRIPKGNYPKEFLGFSLLGRVNTKISDQLKLALQDFAGPNVRITSLRRHWNFTSQHAHGNAVDFEWSEELITYLLTDEGRIWLEKYNLMFYIEDRPRSTKLIPYKQDSLSAPFVFENPNATGPHVHIGIKR